MKRLVVFALLALLSLGARSIPLQNVYSGLCARSDMTQVACSPAADATTQDVSFDAAGGAKVRLRFTSLCLVAAGPNVGDAVTMTACSSASGQLWTLYRSSSSSTTRQYQNDLGNCLGIAGDGLQTSGSSLAVVDCINPSVEWSTNLAYVYSQSGGTTTPVFTISGSTMGAKVAGVTANAGDPCSCSAFAKGAFCQVSSGRAATCRRLGDRAVATNIVPLPVTTRGTSNIPTPLSVAMRNLPIVQGPITLTNGMIVENVHVVRDGGGPCIVGFNVSNVIIRNSEIGPCTTSAIDPSGDDNHNGLNDRPIYIVNAVDNVEIDGNVIHDGSWGIFVQGGQHVKFTNNYVYNVLGPRWGGSVIQIGDLKTVTRQSSVSCNIYNGRYTVGQKHSVVIEDGINFGGESRGTSTMPILVRNNRFLGARIGGGDSGSFMQITDALNKPDTIDAGWYIIQGNRAFAKNGDGISVSGGHDIVVDNNWVDNRGEDTLTNTGPAFQYRTFYTDPATHNPVAPCTNLTLTNNRGIGYLWYYTGTGQTVGINRGTCTGVTESGNNFLDTSLPGKAVFTAPISECGE